MKPQEYQTVIIRLRAKSREDEEALTDLLNERARMGWRFQTLTPLGAGKLLVIFARET